MRNAAWILVIASIAGGTSAASVGCGGSDRATETAAPNAPVESTAVVAPSAPAGPRVDQPTFLLEATPSAAGYAAGQAGAVTIRLEPKAGWHVNQDFPVQIELHGPAELGLAKAQLVRADAAAFDERQFRFEAALTPTVAGSRTLSATVHFAICTDENCLPQDAELALPLEVR